MAVRHHRDLDVWQLADQIRRLVIELTSRNRVRSDFEFCNQAGGAASSVCRNVAEGFWRFRHREFAQFVNIAKGSLGELIDCTDEARQKGYIDGAEHRRLNELIEHALRAATALHIYLSNTPTPPTQRRPAPDK
jgi:four helix bundle protein